MPDLSHLWQRFILAVALLGGLAIGVGATVFGYSNLNPVDIHWSVVELRGVPLWAVVLVPIALILIAGTIFHWLDSLHHFTQHMRHRRRVHELEAEVARLRAHLDQVLEMPQHTDGEAAAPVAVPAADKPSLPAADMADIDAEMATLESAPDDAKAAKAAGGGTRKRAKLLPESPESPPENGDAKPAEPAVVAAASSANDQDK